MTRPIALTMASLFYIASAASHGAALELGSIWLPAYLRAVALALVIATVRGRGISVAVGLAFAACALNANLAAPWSRVGAATAIVWFVVPAVGCAGVLLALYQQSGNRLMAACAGVVAAVSPLGVAWLAVPALDWMGHWVDYISTTNDAMMALGLLLAARLERTDTVRFGRLAAALAGG